MPAARRFPLLLIGAFLALYLVWGSTYLFIRIGVESWPPMLMAGVRFVIAGGCCTVFCAGAVRRRRPGRSGGRQGQSAFCCSAVATVV